MHGHRHTRNQLLFVCCVHYDIRTHIRCQQKVTELFRLQFVMIRAQFQRDSVTNFIQLNFETEIDHHLSLSLSLFAQQICVNETVSSNRTNIYLSK